MQTVTQTYSSPGYYKYTFLEPVFFPMRTVVNLKFTSGSIAVDTTGVNGGYSDVEWDRISNPIRIQSTYGNVFCFNVITNRPKPGMQSQQFNIRRQFMNPGAILVRSRFYCNTEVSYDIWIQVDERMLN